MLPPCARAQRSASSVSARESAPPETATATCGRGSKYPSRVMSRANSASPTAVAGVWSLPGRRCAAFRPPELTSAPEPFLFRDLAILDDRRHLRKIALQLGEGETGIVLAPGIAERHAQFLQIVRRLRALRIFLVPFGEGGSRRRIIAAHEIGLAQPVLRVAGELITGMLPDEAAEGGFGPLEIGVAQQAEGVIVLLRRRAFGQRTSRRQGSLRRRRARRSRWRGRARRRDSLDAGRKGRPIGIAGWGPEPLRCSDRSRGSPRLGRLGRDRRRSAAMFQLLKAHFVVGLGLLQAARQLGDIVLDLFELAGERAQLRVQLIHPDLAVERGTAVHSRGRRRRRADLIAVDLAL